ncbi:RAM signaling network component [Rhodotorula kratochvilovae]
MSSSHNSPRSANLALRPPARSDSNPPSPLLSTSSNAARFNAAYAALPSTSRHVSQTSVSSVASDSSIGFLGSADVAPSPSHDRAFEALQRELSGSDSARGSSEDVSSAAGRGYTNGAREPGWIYDEPEQLDTLRGPSSARVRDDEGYFRARANGSGHEAGSGPSSLDSSTGSLLAPVVTLDASQRPKERRPGDRIFPAPLLLKSDRSYSSGGSGGGAPVANSPFFAPTAPLHIPRRPSASAGASPAPGAGPPAPPSTREWGRREGIMGPPTSSASGDASRAAPSYQRHRQQQSSTSSLSHGSYLPYNNSYSYEPRQTPASAYASPDAPPMSTSSSARNPTPPSTSLSASTTSTLSPSSAEPPISAQALLLDVLSLRSAASPMSLSQSQGPLSRSNTPLLAAGHQRIRSAGSSGSAERDASSRPPEDRAPARPGATYHGGPKLDTVDLSHKRIADVPVEVVDELRDEVEKLALGYNLLKDLPPSFAQLGSRLKYLNIRVNLLTTFPAVLCEMPSIEILDISRNKIRKLPQNPGTLVNLKVFSIAKNRIKRLPVWFTSMTHLKVLKLDHNPLEWPPRDVTTFSATASLSGQPLSKQEEADEMQRWLPALMRWMREHRDREVEREQQREREKRRRPSLAVASEDERVSSEDRLARPPGMTRTESGRLQTSPRIPSSDSIPRTRTVQHIPAAPDALDAAADASIRHSRNASHSTTQTLAPAPRTGLRAKKSLPDLRQSHADILAERRTGTTLEEEAPQPDLPALDGPLRRFREERPAGPAQSLSGRGTPLPQGAAASIGRSESARAAGAPAAAIPRKGTAPPMLDALGKGKRPEETGDLERSSGAYFRRLSMLPVSTIPKTVPLALLHFAEAIRGILFALSQVFSALRQFVVFASQDRLPAPVARLMGSADSSMSTLINALDRFDSLSRRGTPPTAIVRDVFVACRDSVAMFGALVAALQPQLAALTASADARYTRTLLLMLYGSVGEIVSSWSAVAPLLAGSDDPSLATLVLQPPTPSPTGGGGGDAGAQNHAEGPAPRLTRQRSTTRRHAGSFSVEDVQLGANLPPADIPPVPALPGGPLSFDEGAASSQDVNGGATLRTRPALSAKSSTSSAGSAARAAPPPPLAMPPQMGYEQMVQKAFEHPITPGGLFHPVSSGDSRAPSRAGSFSAQGGALGVPPMPPLPSSSAGSSLYTVSSTSSGSTAASSGGASAASYHPHRVSRPVSTLNADETFVDTADSTVSIASDVYGMLLDAFEDPAHAGQFAAIGKRRLKELAELCKAGYDSTQRLQRAIERVRGDDARGRLKFATGEARRLGDASYDFVSNVIRTAKLIKAVSLDFAFSQQMREGIGQLTLGTREFARLLTTSHTSFRPARMMTGEAAGGGAGAGNGAPPAAGARDAEDGAAAGGGEVRPRDFA